MAGFRMRHGDLPVNTLALWDPQTGQALRGRQMQLTYINLLKRDTGLPSAEELKVCLLDSSVWRDTAQGDSKW